MAQAPNLLLTMINMMLKFGGSPDPNEEDYGLYAIEDKEGNSSVQVSYCMFISYVHFYVIIMQTGIQSFLVVLAVICVPWMLFLKPVYLIVQHKRKQRSATKVWFT